ncbi:DNA polymerase subunit beta [Methanobrevibacter sp. DSM 116169]|uniref:DNA polymerase subunit beta n=1 Tax=Methanobrevibacter sp. DSM 116169 TaxID=3242727 RepID=UPI0038FCF316
MEKVRTRDFIHTTDDLFFASTNYTHPEDRYISFLRYIPNPKGDREKNETRYSKVSSEEAYSYLRENYPEYLYFCENTQIEMMGVPLTKVKQIIKPEERLKEIKKSYDSGNNNEIIKKLIDIADFFHFKAGIDYKNLGISGSILPGLQKKEISDIDFVIYGLQNHRQAIATFKKYHNKEININGRKIILNKIEDNFWQKVYEKRMRDSSLSKEEFFWYENRKFNRGLIRGTLFDILATRNYDEITESWNDTKYEPIGTSKIECVIEDALRSFDNPAIYKIKNLKVIEGINENISEIASFTHTYAGEVVENEEVVAKGKIEKVMKVGCEDSYRLVVGTTRESIDEYVKLKDSPIINKKE